METQKKGISGSTLKIIAIVIMFIDHVGAAVVEPSLIAGLLSISNWNAVRNFDYVLRFIGRLSFPIFCFLLVEGFKYTHNKWKYLLNLVIFAVISEIPFNLAIAGTFTALAYQNVFFTLSLGLLAIIAMSAAENKENWHVILKVLSYPAYFLVGPVIVYFAGSWVGEIGEYLVYTDRVIPAFIASAVISGVVLIIVSFVKLDNADERAAVGYEIYAAVLAIAAGELLYTDYSGGGVLVIIAIYLSRKMPYWFQGFVACSILTLMNTMEMTSFFMLIPLCFYNGTRGIKAKYFFYAFYPVHLTLLYLIFLAVAKTL